MSQEQFIQARELIRQKRFDEARAILRTIDHPAAREWLAKLDQIAPVQAPAPMPAAPPAAPSIQQQMIAARELILARRYADARTLLNRIDHPAAREWLAKLDRIAPVQAPASTPAAPARPPITGPAHDEIVREAQHLLLKGDYDRARELLEPLDTPVAVFWLEKTAINQFRSHENLWLDMFHYTLQTETPPDPEAWQCAVCGRRLDEASRCPQRGEPPCPVQVEERPIEEARRLALILEALQHNQAENIEKLAGSTDAGRLERWQTALKWQLTHLLEPDIRRPAIEAAVMLLGQLIEKRRP